MLNVQNYMDFVIFMTAYLNVQVEGVISKAKILTIFFFYGIIKSRGKKRKLTIFALLPRRRNAATRKEVLL